MALARNLQESIEELEQGLGVSSEVLAGATGADRRSVERWRSGQAFPQHEARRRLDRLAELLTRLNGTFATADGVRLWMQTDNRYLGHLKPVEVARAGRLDRLEAALQALDAGVFI